jgi:hypothetical protein
LASVALLALAVGCGGEAATTTDTLVLDPDVVADTTSATDTASAPPDAVVPDDSAAPPDTAPEDTVPDDADSGPDRDSAVADSAPADGSAADTDTGPAPPITVTRPHWRVTFEDDFRGPTGAPSDPYCFDQLDPQCHIWPGSTQDCDLSDVGGDGPFPPTRANLDASIAVMAPGYDTSAMSDGDVKTLYGGLLRDQMADLNKCNWTLYQMVNWMATDYQGHWSARMDGSQVRVDRSGKGYLELSAAYAPVSYDCIYGGSLGGPNCFVYGFAPGELTPGVTYWVDPDPAWPGVYYAPVGGGCPYGGTFGGVNCQVVSFPPHFLEETGVAYWADPDPRWPGVYYANQTYRCRDNIDYAPSLGFRNLTCPILNGAVMSFAPNNKPWIDGDGVAHPRGVMQRFGRFEAKARLPRGIGAFPATWLMPESGGWPYDGGEIDVMEARDAANEAYQTYHHGKCYQAATGQEIEAPGAAECAAAGGVSVHLDKGFTTVERSADELWRRDHLFAVEWTDDRLDFYINNVRTGTITVGTQANVAAGTPAGLAAFESSNFPTAPFYWILNHSTYVPSSAWAGFVKQTLHIDYIRNYVACGTDNAEYCPGAGLFVEGTGCVDGAVVRPSPCQPSDRECVNGGTPDGARCRVWTFAPGELNGAISGYWIDVTGTAPGVYYHATGSGCSYGGAQNDAGCRLAAFPDDLAETGVSYDLDTTASPPGVFYTPDFRQ